MAETKNAVATQEEQYASVMVNDKFITALTQQLNEKTKYGLTFPKDYNVANALMGAYLILKETTDKNGKPILETCSKNSIANSLIDMAVTGLNVQKKQGYFIAYGGKCQFQKSYFGNITIARRYGLKSVFAEIIYDGDVFKYSVVDGKKVLEKHEQDFMNIDNTKIKGAYAIAVMADGEKVMEVMNMPQIKQAWQQGFGYKEGSGTHAKFPDQMAKKTVINRLCKMIINTYGDESVVETYERIEEEENVDTVAEDVAYVIEKNANTEDFIPEQPTLLEEKPAQPTMADVTAGKKEKDPVPAKERPIPPFMKQENMNQ